jgi:hypothetical protein
MLLRWMRRIPALVLRGATGIIVSMSENRVPHQRTKAVVGFLVFAVLVAAALLVTVPRPKRPLSREELEARVGSFPGFAGTASLKFDGADYSGQEAGRVVAADVLLAPGVTGDVAASSMKAAGDLLRERVSVYQKLVVTGYRRAVDFNEGLYFRSRAVWLAPELAAPLDGWSIIRLPDAPRPPERALERIYANPTVKCAAGAITAEIDLYAERRARPAADLSEILSAPLIPTFDYDDAFERSPGLTSVDVTITSSGQKVARFTMTRQAYEATDVSRLLADLSKAVLKISTKEFEIAERYSNTELYTPLLFDKVVKEEDKEEIRAFEASRREAEMRFYNGLFAKGSWEIIEAATPAGAAPSGPGK